MYEIRKLWIVMGGTPAPTCLRHAVWAGEDRDKAEAAFRAAREAWDASPDRYSDVGSPPRLEPWICAVRFDGDDVADVQPLSLCVWEQTPHGPFRGARFAIAR